MGVKIGYLLSSLSWGGLEMNHIRNAQWMHQRGHHVLVLAPEGSPAIVNAREMGLPTMAIERHRKYYDWMRQWKLKRILEKENVTHLFIRDTREMSIGAGVKFFMRSRLKLVYFMEMQLGVKKTHLLHTLRFRQLDAWCCPLPYLKKQVEEMTHMPKERIHLLPSALELGRFQQTLDKKALRNELKLPEGHYCAGLVGRFDRHKGQVIAIEALGLTKDKELHLCLLGEPTRNEGDEYIQAMETRIAENDLHHQTHRFPFRKDTELFYKAMDVIIMASKAETFGMVTVEALASGVPVIGTNASGTIELLDHGKFGKLIPPNDAQALATALVEHKKGLWSVEAAALADFVQQFDHEYICSEIEHLFLS